MSSRQLFQKSIEPLYFSDKSASALISADNCVIISSIGFKSIGVSSLKSYITFDNCSMPYVSSQHGQPLLGSPVITHPDVRREFIGLYETPSTVESTINGNMSDNAVASAILDERVSDNMPKSTLKNDFLSFMKPNRSIGKHETNVGASSSVMTLICSTESIFPLTKPNQYLQSADMSAIDDTTYSAPFIVLIDVLQYGSLDAYRTVLSFDMTSLHALQKQRSASFSGTPNVSIRSCAVFLDVNLCGT